MKQPSDHAYRAALKIVRSLRAAGHAAVLAGGCVRDMLLEQAPKDYDVATDAAPDRLMEIFPRARRVGAKFGVVLVRRSGSEIEVATFRTDGSYSDGRHPDTVTFGTMEQDAQRRDFTVNGLFYDPIDDRLIDYVGGQKDLDARILRTIGDPEHRFVEDHLRMLRAARLAARIGLAIEPVTADAIRRSAHKLTDISAERIWKELEELLAAATRAQGWSLLLSLGLHNHLCSHWKPDPLQIPLLTLRLTALPLKTLNPSLPLACLLCDLDRRTVGLVCQSFRLSNRLTDEVVWLASSLPIIREASNLSLASLKQLMAKRVWPDLMELMRAELEARGAKLDVYDELARRVAAIPPAAVAPPPLLTGDDLTALGVSPGPRLGRILRAVYEMQLNETIASKDQAMAAAQSMLAN